MGLRSALENRIANKFIRYRNEWIRNPQKKKKELYTRGKQVASYISSVGDNIVKDVSTGQSQMFPFKNPKKQSSKRLRNLRSERERLERKHKKMWI